MKDRDREIAATALVKLVELGIPTDIQELLVYGNPSLGVAPGTLSKAVWAAIEAERNRGAQKDASMTRLAMILLEVACLGGMIIMMPDTVAALPFRDRMWCYGLALIFFAIGVSVVSTEQRQIGERPGEAEKPHISP